MMREKDLEHLWKLWSSLYLKYFKLEHLSLEIKFGATSSNGKGEYQPKPKYYESIITFDAREIATETEAIEVFVHELLHYLSQPVDELVNLLSLTDTEINTLYAKEEQQVTLFIVFLKKLKPEMFNVPYEYYKGDF